MSSDLNEVKSVSLSEGQDQWADRLGYEKDSKERMPWEHYLEESGKQIQRRFPVVFPFLMMKRKKALSFRFWEVSITFPGLIFM